MARRAAKDGFIHIGNDYLLRLDRAQLATTDAYVNSGTFEFTLQTAAQHAARSGAIVSGTGSYVTASDGRWHGIIDKAYTIDLEPLEGDDDETSYVWAVITLDNGSAANGQWDMELEPIYRGR